MMNRVRVVLLLAALLLAGSGCTGSDPEPPPDPPIGLIPLEGLPTAEEAVGDVIGATALTEVPEDVAPPVELVARYGVLDPTQQACVLGYGTVALDVPCILGDPAAEDEIVLWGDTHAAQWMPALAQVAYQTGHRLRVFTKFGCPPLLGTTPWLPAEDRPYRECRAFNDRVLEEVADVEPTAVLVSGALRGTALSVDGARVELGRPRPGNGWRPIAERDELWQEGLGRTLRELESLALRTVVIGDTPYPRIDSSVCLPKHPDDLSRCTARRRVAVHEDHQAAVARTARRHGADHVTTSDWVCGKAVCPPVVAGRVVYRDSFHLGRGYVLRLSRALGESAGLLD